jgi:hypothetical protein
MQLMAGAKEVGVDVFFAFSNVMKAESPYGSWGHLEYQDQSPADAPKFQALLDAMAGRWDSRIGTGVADALEDPIAASFD